MIFSNQQLMMIAGVGIAALYYTGKKAATALNPTNQNNIINSSVNSVLYPDGSGSIGSTLYDWFNDSPDLTAPVTISDPNSTIVFDYYEGA